MKRQGFRVLLAGSAVCGALLVGTSVPPCQADLPAPSRSKSNDQKAKAAEPAKTANPGYVDIDFAPYMSDLQRRIKRAWFPPKGMETKVVVAVFKVHQHGELSDLKVNKSSGAAIADKAALKAVENAAPFRPLPTGSPENVDISFTFDYNVFTGGKNAATTVPSSKSAPAASPTPKAR